MTNVTFKMASDEVKIFKNDIGEAQVGQGGIRQ